MPVRYDIEDHTIEVVVEPEFQGNLMELAVKRIVWIVDTPHNKPQIDACWRVGVEKSLCDISRCPAKDPSDRLGNLLEIMGSLDDHYTPYDMSVHGLVADESVSGILQAEGFAIIDSLPDGFVARRIPGVREILIGR